VTSRADGDDVGLRKDGGCTLQFRVWVGRLQARLDRPDLLSRDLLSRDLLSRDLLGRACLDCQSDMLADGGCATRDRYDVCPRMIWPELCLLANALAEVRDDKDAKGMPPPERFWPP
jgi:hypothetical protein